MTIKKLIIGTGLVGAYFIVRRAGTSTGACKIKAERSRQLIQEKWSNTHDDQHTHGELVAAASCYLEGSSDQWPWEESFWKPQDRIRNLTKAGALIAAEIDRLERAKAQRKNLAQYTGNQ